jgi:chromosome segregation ATPase
VPCVPQDAALEGWKAEATGAVDKSLESLREEMTDRARLHGTISNERIAKMQTVAKHDAMSSAERQVWNTLGPQLVQANDRVAELEQALTTLRRKADDAERAAAGCVGSASEQAKLMLSQLAEMTEALEKKDLLWRRQRQRNVETEQRMAELERQTAAAAKAAETKQRQYQAEVVQLNRAIAALDPSRTGGVPLKKLVEVVETQLGLPVHPDASIIIRLSACHRTLGARP